MVALIVAALFWGNCLSCPQMLLAQQPGHGCCHRTGPAAKCQSQGLQVFVKAEAKALTAPAPAIVAPAQAIPEALLSEGGVAFLAPRVHAPPDLLSLISTFRI
jgi:hypothetical protein